MNILGSLLWESDIERKFIELIRKYPEVREILPILLAVRDKFSIVLDSSTKEVQDVGYLFDKKDILDEKWEKQLMVFFNESGLRDLLENKKISNLSDYVFGIETGLDSNARKNRSWTMMEKLVLEFVKNFCEKKGFQYKDQATVKWMKEIWWVEVKTDKSARRFDFAMFTGKKVYLIETNFYGGGGSKLKAVAWEFTGLYKYLQEQDVELLWITDGFGWQSTLRPLEDAYNATNGNIYNLSMLKNGVLNELVK